VVGFGAVLLIRPRTNGNLDALDDTVDRTTILQIAKTAQFWLLSLSMFAFALGMIVPNIYLPILATRLGLPQDTGTILIAVMNGVFPFSQTLLDH
jgi:hypothetical protein